MNKPLILVVEDDPAVARLISTTLETRNYQYHRVQNGAGALLEAASARPDVILLDLGLPDMDGDQFRITDCMTNTHSCHRARF